MDSISIEGEGWAVLEIAPADSFTIEAGEPVLLTYRAVPENADQPLHLSYHVDGQLRRHTFNVGPQRVARLDKPFPSARARAPIAVQTAGTPPNRGNDEGSVAGDAITLRVKGRVVYWRPGDAQDAPVGVDSIWFKIMDEDTISDETMYSGLTNPDGTFDVTFQWDDCDITGCDDPDIYIEYETDSGVVNVQDTDLFETDYTWCTDDDVFEDFTGDFLDFGDLWPADSAQFPALHIYTSIIRTYKFILQHDGTQVEELDLLWPEDDDGAYYDPSDEEIHIGPSRQWNEVTHAHEYGHHFMNNYSINTEPDYCNGNCDTNVEEEECGHCLWCWETDHDAWNEGWPNWLGSVICRSISTDYGVTPWAQANDSRCTLDAIQTCSGSTYDDATLTEGFAYALLRDIEDPNPTWDDHDSTPFADCNNNGMPDCAGNTLDCNNDGLPDCDCDVDAMALGYDEIFRIVREDRPITPLQFIAAFRARHPEHDQDFWSTTRNVSSSYGFPLLTPQITTPPQSCASERAGHPLTITVRGNGSLLRYQWRRDGVNMTNTARITGTTTPSLTFNPLETSDEASYSVLITTCDGTLSIVSPPIRVKVFGQLGVGTAGVSWGRNTFGMLGQGPSAPDIALPNSVVNLNDFATIAPGSWHTVGLRSDGTVWSWGNNTYGQLGDGTNVHSSVPVQTLGLTDIVAIATGGDSSMALKADGKVYVWGSNYYGQLGAPNPGWYYYAPVVLPMLECVTSIYQGGYHGMVIKADGTVWTAGSNSEGQLGLGYFGGWVQSFTQVQGVSDAVSGVAANLHTMVLRANGTLLAWGRNNQGELGDGTTMYRHSPVPVIGLDNVRSVHGAGYHSLAIRNDGTVWGWGSNGYGVLGTPGISNSTAPIQVPGLTNIIATGGTYYSSAFLRADGTVWVVGGNYSGGLGISYGVGSNYVVYTPFQSTTIANATKLFVGAQNIHVLAPQVGPSIALPPPNQSRLLGQNVTFTVSVTGTPQISYEWMFNGLPVANGGTISGANTSALTVGPLAMNHAGNYTVRITNTFGMATSAAGVLTLSATPGDLNGDGAVNGQDFAFFVACFGAPGAMPNPMNPDLGPGTCNAIFDGEADGDVDLRNFAAFQAAFDGQ